MQDDPALSNERAVIAALLAGRMQRVVATERPFGRLGSDRGGAPVLQSGDVLAVPQRTQRVYVVLEGGRVESVEHRAAWLAADYLDALADAGLAARHDYALLYPDGRATSLALAAWNAEPTAVPPGSMLVPGNVCLQVAD